MIIANYNFPEDRKYLFQEPDNVYWVKKELMSSEEGDQQFYFLGITELHVKGFEKELKLTFRSENLQLRENKPFARILTLNRMFELISPVKGKFMINSIYKDNPNKISGEIYNHWMLRCDEIINKELISHKIFPIQEIKDKIFSLIAKNIFSNCKECPDLFQSGVTRRNK